MKKCLSFLKDWRDFQHVGGNAVIGYEIECERDRPTVKYSGCRPYPCPLRNEFSLLLLFLIFRS